MHDPRIITPIPSDLLLAVDEYRFANRFPSRSEAVRHLLQSGVANAQAKSNATAPTPDTHEEFAA
jgi:metal-responsive CopG/Arc/MetJ family transcriptional regulator